MNIIRVRRKISSSQVRISELKNFIGKHVEITVSERISGGKSTRGKKAAGVLAEFKNRGKIVTEKQAWSLAVTEKHGNC